MNDFLFRSRLFELDADIFELNSIEAERQHRKLILIPSESTAPFAVREAVASAFQNIYAEGYPREETRRLSQEELLDYAAQLVHFRRYSDRRYYKGVEYANILEGLARRRGAELFAANGVTADEIFVNVQALSGAPANNAVYLALVKPGETIMGMNLVHGGHLTHGAPVNRSGKFFNAVHYSVDPISERIDYDSVEALALQSKPKIIIAGYSSYPWAVDWKRFRAIADLVGAYLFADIAHVAGLVAAGVYPSPVGYADVITFTTHKSLCGPRGACILTTNERLSRLIDRAVFPGEQGGPHVNTFAGIAVAFKLAQTEQFHKLQRQIVKNCAVFTERLQTLGFRIPYGGTDTHLMNLATDSIRGADGTGLSGDMASRILDLAGVVVNRNTIPGDVSAADPNGIRMGTPWVTQRGFHEAEMQALANIIADVLRATKPYTQGSKAKGERRTKVDFWVLEEAKLRVRELAEAAGYEPGYAEQGSARKHGYPHFYYIDDNPTQNGLTLITLKGERVRQFLNYALTSDVEAISAGETQPTRLYIQPKKSEAEREQTAPLQVDGALTCVSAYEYRLMLPSNQAGTCAAWLRDLSDGFLYFDQDLQVKVPGLTQVYTDSNPPQPGTPTGQKAAQTHQSGEVYHEAKNKPYFIHISMGQDKFESASPQTSLPEYHWEDKEAPLRCTSIYEVHRKLGAKLIPFAGWEMPVWYTSVVEEHQAVRMHAGLFDVAHMGVYQVEGPDATSFLDSVIGNDASYLQVGESLYSHFLDPDANVIDDLLVYRRGFEKFLVVVNASNDDKDWNWLNAVKDGRVLVDREHPEARAYGRNAILRNLRDPKEGSDMRVDVALQGPGSLQILLDLGCDEDTARRIRLLKRTHLTEGVVGGFDLVISRTGYTGERMSFELFVHPDRAEELFSALLKVGEPHGIKPCGLGARDSLRTEAGLPLYGHEMGGELGLGVGEAGFGSYVKTYKPWFIGRRAYLARERERKGEVIRFRFTEKGVRMAHHGDPVIDKRGRVIGVVTSCAIDQAGYLTGQAFLEMRNVEEGMPIFIYQSAAKEVGKAPGQLRTGDRVALPTQATVVSRFPRG
jgi:glycine hydroxymethyltransferase